MGGFGVARQTRLRRDFSDGTRITFSPAAAGASPFNHHQTASSARYLVFLAAFDPPPLKRDSISRRDADIFEGMKTPFRRRKFLATLGMAAVAGPWIAHARKPSPSQNGSLAFSTLGCPGWEWKKILGNAAQWGYAAIELRGILGDLDLPRRPEFSGPTLKGSLADLDALGLKISDLGSSVNMHENDPAKRQKNLDDGKRFIELARELRAPYIRVFGNNWIKGESHRTTLDRVAATFFELAAFGKSAGVTVLIESHGDFTDSPTLLELIERVNRPEAAFLWDAHHTVASGHETPEQTFKSLGKYARHTHLKDSKPDGAGVRYVLLGEGTIPVRETVNVLVKNGYRGYYCFEWEKLWHKDLPEPEIAFPHYAETMRHYLAEAPR
jgi:sugar phosphate isomerase/epimerase